MTGRKPPPSETGAARDRPKPPSETGTVDARDMRKPPASETGAVDARDKRKPPPSETGVGDARDTPKPPPSETGAGHAPASETGAVDARDKRKPPPSETGVQAETAPDRPKPSSGETGAVDARDRRKPPSRPRSTQIVVTLCLRLVSDRRQTHQVTEACPHRAPRKSAAPAPSPHTCGESTQLAIHTHPIDNVRGPFHKVTSCNWLRMDGKIGGETNESKQAYEASL